LKAFISGECRDNKRQVCPSRTEQSPRTKQLNWAIVMVVELAIIHQVRTKIEEVELAYVIN